MEKKILDQLWEKVNKEQAALLATSGNGNVTMRVVSPVYCNDAVLIFTDASSQKYCQLKENPYCCLAVGNVFVEAKAEFLGATMTQGNKELRKVYDEKFPGAFEEGMEHGGRNAEFILFHPVKIKGWAYENGSLEGHGIPVMPFEITL